MGLATKSEELKLLIAEGEGLTVEFKERAQYELLNNSNKMCFSLPLRESSRALVQTAHILGFFNRFSSKEQR